MDRRRFLKNVVRGSILVGLGIVSGNLLLKKAQPDSETCDYNFICRDCKKLKDCKLPEANKFKQTGNTE